MRSRLPTTKEANQAVDILANLRLDCEIRVVYFDSPPNEVLDVLYADVVGPAWPRNMK